jgi:hypothetical protein
MRRFYITFLAAIGMLVSAGQAVAQQSDENPFPTPNTVIGAKPDPKKQQEKSPRIRYIIKSNTKNTLLGNKCFEEATRKMGFQYLAVPKGQPPYKNEFAKFWHNLSVKTALFFKNGPFWKIKVNKKLKECRYRSGDYVG